ncbi:unnamed protein product, partial [Choristocarpus tenellus]
GSGGSGGVGDGGGGGKAPPVKKRKGGGGWRAKNGEQVAVRDEREASETWILARVMKYMTDSHHYEVKDEDDQGGGTIMSASRSSVIRLEDSTKGVDKGEEVLAVFPDTTSFYYGTVHKLPKPGGSGEKIVEVKFKDDADETGRTPARPVIARYVVPIPHRGGVKGGGAENDNGERDSQSKCVVILGGGGVGG